MKVKVNSSYSELSNKGVRHHYKLLQCTALIAVTEPLLMLLVPASVSQFKMFCSSEQGGEFYHKETSVNGRNLQ